MTSELKAWRFFDPADGSEGFCVTNVKNNQSKSVNVFTNDGEVIGLVVYEELAPIHSWGFIPASLLTEND